jgi:hypothetical protein
MVGAPSPTPEWRGITDSDTGASFLIVGPGETEGRWEKVGDTFGDWTISIYHMTDRTLVVERNDGTKFDLILNPSPATAAVPTSAVPGMAYAIDYLEKRSAQLRREYEAAKKEFEDFKEQHNGMDPSQMTAGAIADEGNALKTKATTLNQTYLAVLKRLAETQNYVSAPPSSSPHTIIYRGAPP